MLDCSLLLKTGEQILKKNGILTSRLDSEVLLSSIAGKDRLELVSKENLKVSNEQALDYQQMIERRKKGKLKNSLLLIMYAIGSFFFAS